MSHLRLYTFAIFVEIVDLLPRSQICFQRATFSVLKTNKAAGTRSGLYGGWDNSLPLEVIDKCYCR